MSREITCHPVTLIKGGIQTDIPYFDKIF